MARKPYISAIFKLKCPQCLNFPLRAQGSWFTFRKGCPSCRYHYEREEGYFLGSPWMINYPLTAVLSIALAIHLFSIKSEFGLSSLGVSAIVASFATVVSLFLFPFAKVTWMVIDHFLHPITDSDRLFDEKIDSNKSNTL